jgi:hypothetical protein
MWLRAFTTSRENTTSAISSQGAIDDMYEKVFSLEPKPMSFLPHLPHVNYQRDDVAAFGKENRGCINLQSGEYFFFAEIMFCILM